MLLLYIAYRYARLKAKNRHPYRKCLVMIRRGSLWLAFEKNLSQCLNRRKGPSASEKRRREIIYPCASNFQFQLSKRPAQPVSWRCRSHGSLDERFCPRRECAHPSRRKKSSGEEVLCHSARRKTVQPFYPNR